MPTLYEKRGRRYIPVADDRAWDNWPHGTHIVHTPNDGGRSIRFSINPETAGLQAAIELKRDELVKEISSCFELQPCDKKLTPAEAKAWHAFTKAMRNPFAIQRESVQGCVDRIMRILEK